MLLPCCSRVAPVLLPFFSRAAAALQALSAAKPTVSYSDGLMCSALYWIGSAAPKVYVSGPMVQVGSIGVRMDTADTSGKDAKEGVARKTYTFGKYKARGGTGICSQGKSLGCAAFAL